MHPYVPTLLALLLMTTTCQSILLGKITPWSESQWGHQVQIHCQPNLYRTNAREEVHYNTHEHTHTLRS
jgi:hypothetical protein